MGSLVFHKVSVYQNGVRRHSEDYLEHFPL